MECDRDSGNACQHRLVVFSGTPFALGGKFARSFVRWKEGLGMSDSIRLSILCLTIASFSLAGCGGQSPYPEAAVRSPLGREGVCFACQEKIASVSPANLVTVGAVQFVVCDEKCADQVKANARDDHHDH